MDLARRLFLVRSIPGSPEKDKLAEVARAVRAFDVSEIFFNHRSEQKDQVVVGTDLIQSFCSSSFSDNAR